MPILSLFIVAYVITKTFSLLFTVITLVVGSFIVYKVYKQKEKKIIMKFEKYYVLDTNILLEDATNIYKLSQEGKNISHIIMYLLFGQIPEKLVAIIHERFTGL